MKINKFNVFIVLYIIYFTFLTFFQENIMETQLYFDLHVLIVLIIYLVLLVKALTEKKVTYAFIMAAIMFLEFNYWIGAVFGEYI